MELGDRIKALREKRDWSQTMLAKKIGVSKSVMSRIEAGTRPLEDSLLIKLSDVLEESSDYLLGIAEKGSDKLSNNDREIVDSIRRLPEFQKSAVKTLVDSMIEKNKG
jgi:transcriptional regulator with XRE-family HTH domain